MTLLPDKMPKLNEMRAILTRAYLAGCLPDTAQRVVRSYMKENRRFRRTHYGKMRDIVNYYYEEKKDGSSKS